jgi:hypothetical protein
MMAIALSDHAICLSTEDHVPRKEVITRVIDYYSSEQLQALRRSLEDAKQQVLSVWATYTRGTQLVKKVKRTRHGAAKVTSYFSLSSFQERVVRSEFAEGSPYSAQRITQTLLLWDQDVEDLHLRIGREHKEEWMAWANGVGTGKSYFVSSIASGPQDDPSLWIIKQYAPKGADVTSPEVRRAAKEAAGRTLRAGWTKATHSSKLQRERASRGSFFKDLNGTTVLFNRDKNSITLYWDDGADGSVIILFLPTTKAPVIAPISIHFNTMGIALHDYNNQLIVGRWDNTVTWSLVQMQGWNEDSKKQIMDCWEAHMGYKWTERTMQQGVFQPPQPTPAPSTPKDPVNVPIPPLTRTTARPADLGKYSTPPKPHEGTYLMNAFLNSAFPAGGSVIVGNITKFPQDRPRHLVSRMKDFIQSDSAEVRSNVWSGWYTQVLNNADRLSVSHLKVNLGFCRTLLDDSGREQIGGRAYRVWSFGPRKPGW